MFNWVTCFSVLMVIVQTSGLQYCSDTIQPASCVPCGEDGTYRYKCPRQCGNERTLDQCNVVCSDFCVKSECEYDVTRSLVCVHGCKTGHYGAACHQICNNCLDGKCDINGTCSAECKPGYYGKRCEHLCDQCKKCEKNSVDCEVCDTSNGKCLLGCNYGYYGATCDKQCPTGCTQCHIQTGECQQCLPGSFGRNCQQKCPNCQNKLCHFETGQCRDGCEKGFQLQGTSCQKLLPEKEEGKDPEEQKAMTGLSGIFEDEDYLLPVIGCLVVLCAVIAVVVFWRCRKSKVKENPKADVEEGTCNGLTPHPSLRRSSKDSSGTPPLYKHIVEEAIRTHSCEEILKKHNLLDPDKPRLSPLGDKPLASLRNRTGNLSMPFMTPIEEDEEEEAEDDGVHMPNVGIIFTLEPPSDDEGCEDRISAISKLTGSQDSSIHEANASKFLRSSNSGTSVDHSSCSTDPAEEIYILQRGPQSPTESRAITSDYLDTTHSSGRSTPMVPDMYVNHPHVEENHFTTMLSDHLDTYLTDRAPDPDTEARPVENGTDIDVSESDALLGKLKLQNNNNHEASKSRNSFPNKLKKKNLTFEPVIENGHTEIEMEHVSLSEREPMLSHTSDSNA